MSDNKNPPNFPDVLGMITGGERININIVQLAIATRPRVIRAGKPFETILLVQNAADVPIDFTAIIKLPERDAKGKKGRFVTKVDKLVIGLEPAQMGYVTLPVSTLPDTAVSPDYSITMDVQVKPASDQKPRRIRSNEGGGAVKTDQLSEETLATIEELKHLNWMVHKSSGFRSTGVDAKFGLMSGTVGSISDLQPGWQSLWTMADLIDDSLLLKKHRKVFIEDVIGKLGPSQTYELLLDHTYAKFRAAGFELLEWEAVVVTKMLALILTYAAPPPNLMMEAGRYNLKLMLAPDETLEGEFTLPNWASAFLNLLNREPRAVQQPTRAVMHFCFEGLLKDAILHGFERIETATGQNIGTTEEREDYASQFLSAYKASKLNFQLVYLPLVLGGVTAADAIILPNDNMESAVIELSDMVNQRRRQFLNEDTQGLFDMTDELMAKVLLKYGYDAKRM